MSDNIHRPKDVRAAIFDLDGVIISSKVAEYESWRRVFRVFNSNLTLQQWVKIIDSPDGVFDPATVLRQKCKIELLANGQIETMRTNLYESLRRELVALPGIVGLIKECTSMDLMLGVASNGDHTKVMYHLGRLKLLRYFHVIKCRDDVRNKKPAPDIYMATVRDLGVNPGTVVVFEDSPPGITAAKAAGLYCIGCPNKITKYLDLSEADEICKSFKRFSMQEFINPANKLTRL